MRSTSGVPLRHSTRQLWSPRIVCSPRRACPPISQTCTISGADTAFPVWYGQRRRGLSLRRRAAISAALTLPIPLPVSAPVHVRNLLGEASRLLQTAIHLPADYQEQGQQQEVKRRPEQIPREKGQGRVRHVE